MAKTFGESCKGWDVEKDTKVKALYDAADNLISWPIWWRNPTGICCFCEKNAKSAHPKEHLADCPVGKLSKAMTEYAKYR